MVINYSKCLTVSAYSIIIVSMHSPFGAKFRSDVNYDYALRKPTHYSKKFKRKRENVTKREKMKKERCYCPCREIITTVLLCVSKYSFIPTLGPKIIDFMGKIRRLGFSPISSVDLLFPKSTLCGECLSTYFRLCITIMYFRTRWGKRKKKKKKKKNVAQTAAREPIWLDPGRN